MVPTRHEYLSTPLHCDRSKTHLASGRLPAQTSPEAAVAGCDPSGSPSLCRRSHLSSFGDEQTLAHGTQRDTVLAARPSLSYLAQNPDDADATCAVHMRPQHTHMLTAPGPEARGPGCPSRPACRSTGKAPRSPGGIPPLRAPPPYPFPPRPSPPLPCPPGTFPPRLPLLPPLLCTPLTLLLLPLLLLLFPQLALPLPLPL